MKIKIIKAYDYEDLETRINKFIKDKDIIDIKLEVNHTCHAMIIYKI